MLKFPGALLMLALSFLAPIAATPAAAQSAGYSSEEIVREGHAFFGGAAEGLATLVERSIAQYGLPNGYILGQEGSGAIFLGARYGEGTLYTKNAGQHPVFWQGPSLGFDIGGSGDRVMMLVYNLPDVSAMYQRFPGITGTAHIVAGFGMTALGMNGIYVVPIVSGVGARVGINIGYLNFTPQPTWVPF